MSGLDNTTRILYPEGNKAEGTRMASKEKSRMKLGVGLEDIIRDTQSVTKR